MTDLSVKDVVDFEDLGEEFEHMDLVAPLLHDKEHNLSNNTKRHAVRIGDQAVILEAKPDES